MYQKYSTEALVLGGKERGEADKIFTLYTRDFGLIHARASAVRKESSRMRYALQNYARAHVALVRGKRGWRIGGAISSLEARGSIEGVLTFARIGKLLMRLVGEGEQNQYLFATLSDAHRALMQGSVSSSASVEIVCVARMLYALGYLSVEALRTALFTHTAYQEEHLLEAETIREKLLFSINHALTETHL